MSYLLQILEQPANIVYSVLILISVGIWLITVIGFISMSALDGIFDFAFDHEIDLDTDADIDADIADSGAFLSILGFVGVGKVPTTLIVTVMMFLLGLLGLTFHYFLFSYFSFTGITNWIIGIVGFGVNFFIALFATALVMRPLYPLFQDYGKVETSKSLVGQVASITSGKATNTFGQARIKLEGGDSVEITVRSNDTHEAKYGERVLVVDYDEEKNIYYVAEYQE